jgi:hypothetical protein
VRLRMLPTARAYLSRIDTQRSLATKTRTNDREVTNRNSQEPKAAVSNS